MQTLPVRSKSDRVVRFLTKLFAMWLILLPLKDAQVKFGMNSNKLPSSEVRLLDVNSKVVSLLFRKSSGSIVDILVDFIVSARRFGKNSSTFLGICVKFLPLRTRYPTLALFLPSSWYPITFSRSSESSSIIVGVQV